MNPNDTLAALLADCVERLAALALAN